MVSRILIEMKSKEELLSQFSVHCIGDEFTSIISNSKESIISNFIWDICSKEIEVVDNSMFSHGYDYSYTHTINVDGFVRCPIIYLKKEWLKVK